MEHGLSISNRTRTSFPRLPLLDIKKEILGEKYDLSIVFVTDKESRNLNKKYRGLDKPTNILTFPLKKNGGEILLCPKVIRKESKEKKFDRDFRRLTGFLVIHGMLHLKGVKHSSRMESKEEKYDQKYFGGNRRGLRSDPRSSRRVRKGRKNS